MPAITLKGKVIIDGEPIPKLPLTLRLTPLEASGRTERVPTESNSNFTFDQLEPLQYSLRMQSASDLYISSIEKAGVIIRGEVIDLSEDLNPQLTIFLRRGAAQITGTASEKGSQVMLLPDGQNSALLVIQVTTEGDTFELRNVSPGTYRVVAVPAFRAFDMQNPILLDLVGIEGQEIKVKEHDQMVLKLKTVDQLTIDRLQNQMLH